MYLLLSAYQSNVSVTVEHKLSALCIKKLDPLLFNHIFTLTKTSLIA